ncbi:hypothetical protein BY458DRAFT_498396 [Sporodiniella umbellata]|nr:hypothetical protein BY458DRAFT_498396 [Sporodiniella umbellata]
MTKLKVLYQQWNAEQRDLYRPVISALLDLGISTEKELLKADFDSTCSCVTVHRWLIRGFVEQVLLDTSALPERIVSVTASTAFFPTDFPDLNDLLDGGFRFYQVIELCGSSSGQTRFIAHLLGCYALSVSNQNMYVFGSTGVFEAKKTSEILEKKGMDSKKLLSQIEYSQVFSLEDLSFGLERLGALLVTTRGEKGLVVIETMSKLVVDHAWSSKTSKAF